MTARNSTRRVALTAAILAATSLGGTALAQDAAKPAQEAPKAAKALSAEGTVTDLYHLAPKPKYNPPKTAWGGPDLTGKWPIDSLGGLPLQRTEAQGNRV